jgi:hypothetical protein
MCIEVRLDNQDIGTQGELRAVMPKGIVWHEGWTDSEDEHCLCGMDEVATARLNGYESHMDENYMYAIFERINAE